MATHVGCGFFGGITINGSPNYLMGMSEGQDWVDFNFPMTSCKNQGAGNYTETVIDLAVNQKTFDCYVNLFRTSPLRRFKECAIQRLDITCTAGDVINLNARIGFIKKSQHAQPKNIQAMPIQRLVTWMCAV